MLTMKKRLEYNSAVILADKIIHSQKLPNRYLSTALHNIKNEITAHLLPPPLRHCEERSDAAITSNYCQENLKHKVHSMVTLSNKQ